MAAPGENGVEVAVGGGAGVLTYELRVPLSSSPWGVGVRPGATIGVAVTTNRMAPWSGGRARDEDGGPGGGRRGPGGGGRGMGRGGPPGGGPRGEWQGVQAWARVRLATGR